ncbi:MAG: hypothetical protein ACLFN2_07420, partial [Bacteroidales bacterium]
IEMVSYWKAFCSPRILIQPHRLSSKQQSWWKNLYRQGLGEFFYMNGIDIPGAEMVEFVFDENSRPLPGLSSENSDDAGNRVLVPVGGGKDSVVTLELLKSSGFQIVPFVVNPRGATNQVLEVASPADSGVVMTRKIDPLLLRLNDEGFLNGHTPFSAMLAFASAFVARFAGIRHIALSNESSASEPTIPGTGINHQYSKSLDFEQDFRQYMSGHLDAPVNYFSFLRPLNELQIAAMFSRYRRYHDVFKSCNVGSKTDSWCGACPKCLFTYIILSPFLTQHELMRIFGKDLFADEDLIGILEELSGTTGVKPFECVGTIDEVNMALVHTVDRMLGREGALPVLLNHYHESALYAQYKERDIGKFLCDFDKKHCLSTQSEQIIRREVVLICENTVTL